MDSKISMSQEFDIGRNILANMTKKSEMYLAVSDIGWKYDFDRLDGYMIEEFEPLGLELTRQRQQSNGGVCRRQHQMHT